MSEPASPSPPPTDQQQSNVDDSAVEPADRELVVEDLLVEEVSIDGMCGVY